ncbi:phospholipid carrier-dependent glycosyltransferase [Luteolibacter soli]|uniref:Phospholipid carrier-dependent glycosyltransferase n=1 Tax=Luteolibacter soli TaxID=3135280 RepID=A0ABU9B2R2_9BACT
MRLRYAIDPEFPTAGGGEAPAAAWPGFRKLVTVALLALFWFCAFIGLRPLANPDEGRYTEIAREMAESGDYVTPRLNGVKYFEKPPLMYWLSALTFKAFGLNQFTARLWVALFATLGCLLTYVAAHVLYGQRAGIWSAIVLSSSLIYYVLGQLVLLDMAVSVMISGALFSFILAVREPAGRRRFWLFMAHYGFMALATLSKGLIGFLIPGAVMFLWLLMLGNWRMLRPLHLLPGAILFLAISVPWHIAVATANHSANHQMDFAWFYFIHEHFERFTTTVHQRYEPWWFFLPFVIGGLFPWVVLAWQAVSRALAGGWRERTKHAEAWFLVLWIGFIVLFFSASQSKLIPYILPVIPACAVLIGRYVAECWDTVAGKGLTRGGMAFAVLAIVIGIAAFVVKPPAYHDALAEAFPMLRAMVAGVFIPAGLLAVLASLRKSPRWVIGCIAGSAILLFPGIAAMGRVMDGESTVQLSHLLQQRLTPTDRVIHLGMYAQDMPAYLGRQVDVAAYKGELQFGIDAEPERTDARFISRARFIEEWREPHTTYALMRTFYYDKWFRLQGVDHEVIGHEGDLYLLVNRNPNSVSQR